MSNPILWQTDGTTADQNSPWFIWNFQIDPFAVGMGAFATGTNGATVTVQHTFDDPNRIISPNSDNPPLTFVDANISATALTANTNKTGNIAFPVFASRLVVTSIGAATVIKFKAIQAGITQR